MTTWNPRANELFLKALELPSADERQKYLAEACTGETALQAEVESLLEANARAGGFLESPARALLPTVDEPISEHPGTVIGPYKLLEQIGEGGFGVVFMAEQTQPVRRKVALKVLKPGMDTRQVVARFEAERQALALMDHPNIAHVFDGGETATGRPYFVMELVRGIPITEFADQNQLPVPERLALFVSLCQAVQHAHQRGIIHRDLKPTNIMVTLHDATPVAKVIDFGIAKATGQQLTEKTLFTNFAQMIGTPQYMSPEQTQMSGLDVDTRSDIYSLGVLLYELLTGTTPFHKERLKKLGYDEIRRIIREEEPPKPSTRISTLGQAAAPTSANRGSDPKRLSQLFRGELDWIVMKALDKDRNRRYETASAFAADVQRYLKDEPVQACPPSAMYRFRKFARRNKAALITASLVLTAIVAGTAMAMWQALIATHAHADALAEATRADRQAALAANVSQSLKQLLGSLNPDAAKGPDYTARQVLDDFAENLEVILADEPEAASDLHTIIGQGYACVGERDKAEKHLRRALELRRVLFGEHHEKYAESLVEYSRPDVHNGLPAAEGSEADLRRALAIYRSLGIGGAPVIRALQRLKWNLVVQSHAGKPAKRLEIEPVAQEALAEAAKSPGVEFREMPSVLNALVDVRVDQGRYAEAEQIARDAVALDLRLKGTRNTDTGWSYAGLGSALKGQRKFAAAFEAEKQALSIMRRALPRDHASIAFVLVGAHRTLDEARSAKVLAELFPSPVELRDWQSILRDILAKTPSAQLTSADQLEEPLEGLVRLAEIYQIRAQELDSAGKAQDAERMRQEALLLSRNLQVQLSERPDLLAYYQSISAISLMLAGKPKEAQELSRKLLELASPKTLNPLNSAAWFLATAADPAHRDPALAAELAKKVIELDERRSKAWQSLGWAQYRIGNWKASLQALERACALQEESKGGEAWQWFGMAMAYWQLGDRNESHRQYERAVEWTERFQPGQAQLRRFRAEAAELLGVEKQKD